MRKSCRRKPARKCTTVPFWSIKMSVDGQTACFPLCGPAFQGTSRKCRRFLSPTPAAAPVPGERRACLRWRPLCLSGARWPAVFGRCCSGPGQGRVRPASISVTPRQTAQRPAHRPRCRCRSVAWRPCKQSRPLGHAAAARRWWQAADRIKSFCMAYVRLVDVS